MSLVKIYDVKNSYLPNDSLSYILNSYKTKINYPMVFHQQIDYIGDYKINYDDISNMPIYVSYYDKN